MNVSDAAGADAGKLQDEEERSRWRDDVAQQAAVVLRAQLDVVCPEEGADLGDIDRRTQRAMRVANDVVWTACAERAVAHLPRPMCCGEPMHVAVRRARRVRGLVADGSLRRTEFVCSGCGRRCAPADEVWGLGSGQYSPGMAQLACRAGAEIPSFDRAAAILEEALGVPVCADTVARTSEAVGAVAEQEQQQAMALVREALKAPGDGAPLGATDLPPHLAVVREALASSPVAVAEDEGLPSAPCPESPAAGSPVPAPAGTPTLLLGIDATKALANRQWRDAKVAVLAPLGPESTNDAKHRRRLVLGPRSYCAAIEEVGDFFLRLLVLLIGAGWRRGTPLRLALVGDGGPWIWSCADRLRQLGIHVVEILDIYHAREHITAVAAVYRDPQHARRWAAELSEAIATEGAAPVLAALQRLRPRSEANKETVRKAIDYFTGNAARMDYARYAAAGLPLGSGIVESACRLVSGLRVKQPGMRWSLPGVQAILSLRALHLSQTSAWTDFWKRKPLPRCPNVHRLTRARVRAA